MINTRTKMYYTNSIIKKFLMNKGFHQLYLFPHSRFLKDYHFEGYGFDAIGWKNRDKRIYLIQFKSNEKPTIKTIEEYKIIEKKYYCKCLWITKFDRKGIKVFGANYL